MDAKTKILNLGKGKKVKVVEMRSDIEISREQLLNLTANDLLKIFDVKN